MVLLYGGERQNDNLIVGHVNSDYARDLDNKKSLTCYLYIVNNCTINWKATLQSVVTLSTTEAEYTTKTQASKEAIWLKGILK